MAIDLNMCEPNGSDLAGHGSQEIVLKLNAPINSQTVGNKELVETFFNLDGATYEHACRYEDCKKKNKKVLAKAPQNMDMRTYLVTFGTIIQITWTITHTVYNPGAKTVCNCEEI